MSVPQCHSVLQRCPLTGVACFVVALSRYKGKATGNLLQVNLRRLPVTLPLHRLILVHLFSLENQISLNRSAFGICIHAVKLPSLFPVVV